MLSLEPPESGQGDRLVAMRRANAELRAAYHATASRPVALSTGSRLLVRLVDELEWLTTTVANACSQAPEEWPEQGRRLRAAAASVLESAATVLAHRGGGPSVAGCDRLDVCLAHLEQTRNEVSDQAVVALRAASQVGVVADAGVTLAAAGDHTPGEFERPLYAAHELGYQVAMAGHTVAVIAAADARNWLDRLIGRRPRVALGGDIMVFGEAEAAQHLAVSHFDRHSVWLQNSVRGAAGLAFAVLLARISGQQEGFWIVLGALSVLRSNALTIGATIARVLLGTLFGFAIGALLLAVIGTNDAVLWPVLPIAVFIAGFAPDAISFAAGQAAFTVVVIVLFNIIAPVGWRLGVLRIEDVALGCAASLVAGALFWPRGAGAALGNALGDAYRMSAAYLRESVHYLSGRHSTAPAMHGPAQAAAYRLDDALRQYLAERGAKRVTVENVTSLANGAARVRLAGNAVSRLRGAYPDTAPDVDDPALAEPVAALTSRTEDVTRWYAALGDVLSGAGDRVPAIGPTPDPSFLDVVLPAVDRCGDPDRAARAERLLWSGQYVGDVGQVRPDLVAPADEVRLALRVPWWRP
jgi:hypothetical protein